jgi:hypothetical protein
VFGSVSFGSKEGWEMFRFLIVLMMAGLGCETTPGVEAPQHATPSPDPGHTATVKPAVKPAPKAAPKAAVVSRLPTYQAQAWMERNQKKMVLKDGRWQPIKPKAMKAKQLPKPAKALEKVPR